MTMIHLIVKGFSIGLLVHNFLFADEDVAKEYEENLKAVNDALDELASTTSLCPGSDLALSCGDLTCDADTGEDKLTCPTDCSSALLRSYNSQTFCDDVKEIIKPLTYAEIEEAIKKAVAERQKIRVIGKAHSTNSQLCTDGYVISTEKLNHIRGIEIFEGHETVVVEAGVSEKELTEWLHTKGKAIGYGLVGFRGITVGGMVATGTHGSSAKHSAMLSSAVQSLLIVTADGKLKEFSKQTTEPELFKALCTHMSMFGVVVEMRLKIRQQFNLDTEISFLSEEAILDGSNPQHLVDDCDFGQIHWFPSTRKIMKTCGYETNRPADASAENIYLDPYIPTPLVVPYKVAFHYGACSENFNALFENLRFTVAKLQPPMVKENIFGSIVNTRHAIGNSHRMMSSNLGLGRETLIVRDWEVALPSAHVAAALKSLRKYLDENRLSLPITGFFIRFTPVEDTTLIGNATSDGEFKIGDVVTFLEFPSYYPIGFSAEEKENYAKLYERMIHLLITDFHARPHWGKNSESVFSVHKSEGNEKHLLQRFKNWVDIFDPSGLFKNDFRHLIFDAATKSTPKTSFLPRAF